MTRAEACVIANETCLIYARRKEEGWGGRGSRFAERKRRRKPRKRGDEREIGPLNIIFSARENFSLFRFPLSLLSPLPSLRGWMRRCDEGRKSFPSSLSFRSYVTDCGTRRAVIRPVVCQTRREISLRDVPLSFLFFLFLSTSRHRLRSLSNDALLPHLCRQKREVTRENLSKLDSFGIKIFYDTFNEYCLKKNSFPSVNIEFY